MNLESPIVALGVLTWMVVFSATQIADGMPDPGQPTFPTLLGTVGAFVGGAFHLVRHRTREGIQLASFMFALGATGIGLAIYSACLIALAF